MAPAKPVTTALFALVLTATWIQPLWPLEQALHGSLTVLACLFLSVHSVAARWLYSNVPYEAWSQALFGVSPDTFFGWKRNQFDRMVHFLYGACLTPAIAAQAQAKYGVDRRRAFHLAIAAIMLTGLWYEWLEWLVAVALGEGAAESYNGQQGDIWDAHKDMAIAALGSLLWWRR
jgi:putative membrane protein